MSAFEEEKSKAQQSLENSDKGKESTVADFHPTDGEPEVIETPYTKESFKEALQSKDNDAVSSMLNGLNLKDAKEIASDSELMGLVESLDETIRNSVYDKIYMGIEDVDTLCKIAYKRFGVAFGTKYSDDEKALKYADTLLRSVVTNNQHASYRATQTETMETIEKPWTLNGAQHLYSVYSRAPEAHLQNLKIVMTTNATTGGFGGLANSKYGVYLLTYNDSEIDTALETSLMYHSKHDENGEKLYNTDLGLSVDENDGTYGLNLFDETAAHEFGHVVDYTHSPVYSETEEFRKLSGWKEYYVRSEEGAEDVVKDLRSYMPKPDPENLSGDKDAADIIDMIAGELVMDDAASEDKIAAKVDDFLNSNSPSLSTEDMSGESESIEDMEKRLKELNQEWIKNSSSEIFSQIRALQTKITHAKRRQKSDPVVNAYMDKNNPDADAFANSLKSAPILKHITRVTSSKSPWFYHEPFNELEGRQIHSDYHSGKWFSYDMKARSNKISSYQFSDPAEEFAELYASYMAADESTRKTPEPYKTWFEEHVLKDATAQQSSEQKEGKKKKWWQFWK